MIKLGWFSSLFKGIFEALWREALAVAWKRLLDGIESSDQLNKKEKITAINAVVLMRERVRLELEERTNSDSKPLDLP